MKNQQINRFTPLQLGPNLRLRNRVVVPSMASQTATTQGLATAATIAHYKNLSRSGAGLVIVEYSFVHLTGRSEIHQLGNSDPLHLPGLSQIAEVIKASDAVAGIQLTHSGGKSDADMTSNSLMGPSRIPVPVKGDTLETPKEMLASDIQLWKDAFLQSAIQADAAGFQLIELHAAHGYGLNQWLSPLTNQRKDEYGGTLENRFRLLSEILVMIRKKLPQCLLSVRLPGQDFLPGGLSKQDCVQMAKWLEELGINVINVSSGIGGWRRPEVRVGQGYLVEEASLIQSKLKIPVIGVGGIVTGSYIDEALQAGKFSLAAVGRALLTSPDSWGLENLKEDSLLPPQVPPEKLGSSFASLAQSAETPQCL